MKKWTVLAVVALVVVVGSASLTFARNGWMGAERKSTGWVEVLDLKDDQIDSIQSVLRQSNQDKLSKMQEFHQTMGALRELEWSRDYTEDKANELIETMKSIREEMMGSRKAGQERIQDELTEEQKELYREQCGRWGDGEKPAPRDGSGSRRGKGGNETP